MAKDTPPAGKFISIRGAREHNLKNVDLDLPRDSLVVLTGLSGSGKSSLAFDTIYAEGQRRYVESLSAYARQFLEMMQKPDVDQIDGLSPAISIEQKTTSRNPRSTVGTVTEIYDYMRLLFARVGVPYSPATGQPIESQTVSQMVDRVLALPEGTRLYLLAPIVRGRKGEYRKELAELMKRGFQRVKIDGQFHEIAEAPALDKKIKHDIEVVVDRIVVRGDIATRLADSFQTALELADGIAIAEFADTPQEARTAGGRTGKQEEEARSAGGATGNEREEARSAGGATGNEREEARTAGGRTGKQEEEARTAGGRTGKQEEEAKTAEGRTGSARTRTPLPDPPPQGGREKRRGSAAKSATGGARAEAADMASPPPLRGRDREGGTPQEARSAVGATGKNEDQPTRIVFSEKFACPVSGFTIPEIEPRLFSFNNPYGACPVCDGLGSERMVDAALVVPDHSLSLRKNAVAPWGKSSSPYYLQTLDSLARHYRFSLDTAWAKLPEQAREVILYGTGDDKVKFTYDDGLRKYDTTKTFEGVIPNLERRWKETDSAWMREEIERYQSSVPCAACAGKRLKPEALAVKLDRLDIAEVADFSIRKANQWFEALPATLSPKQTEIAGRILKEIRERLQFLVDVGLDYLTLARASGTLSGGESQRIRLASQIGSGLTGVLYVLDEPSIGLHQRDNARLLETLKHLRDLGNTVIVVEHDEDAIREADYVVDIGPAAGIHGGEIVAEGTPADIMANPKSLTGQFLSGTRFIETPVFRRQPKKGKALKVSGATGNNLKAVTAEIPLGLFTCVTGVSGGGKSTLLIDTIYKAVARRLNGARDAPAPHERLEGLEYLDKVIDIDQSPIGRTPRSNPATYTGAFTPIREWFAGLPEAKARGYLPGRFSFNVKGGRCEACQGDGVIKIEMHFLPDVYVTCDVCKGKRYNRETLEVTFKQKSIADILDMTVEEAKTFFAAVPSIRDKMETLDRVGLSYIHVGQQATTLSGGEAQRVKLSKELSKRATGRTLYILDEPTTGLHFADVEKLLEVLHELVEQGNTVVVIEHNLEVIKTADWIIDLGPEGGDAGGEIVAAGSPEDIVKVKRSYTGAFLKPVLARARAARARGGSEAGAEAAE